MHVVVDHFGQVTCFPSSFLAKIRFHSQADIAVSLLVVRCWNWPSAGCAVARISCHAGGGDGASSSLLLLLLRSVRGATAAGRRKEHALRGAAKKGGRTEGHHRG